MRVLAVRTGGRDGDWQYLAEDFGHLADTFDACGPDMLFDQCSGCGESLFQLDRVQARGKLRWVVKCEGCDARYFPHKRAEDLVVFP